MRRLGLIGIFVLASVAACPKPVPTPVTPVAPPDVTCTPDEQLHDMVVNDVVNALQDNTGLDAAVQRYDLGVVRCVVQEVINDVQSAPQLVGRAQYWLSVNGGS